jgi:hypothetical protein
MFVWWESGNYCFSSIFLWLSLFVLLHNEQDNVGASVKVNIINKVTVIDNVSAVKIRHGRWQALSSLFPTIIQRLRSSTAIYSI